MNLRPVVRIAVLLAAVASCGDARAVSDWKILAIGDSITQGGRLAGELSYRWSLRRKLCDAKVPFRFVGTRSGGLDPAFAWPRGVRLAHEGYYGARTGAVVDQVTRHLPSIDPPDIALIDVGTNDAGDYGPTVVAPLEHLIDALRGRNPNVVVLLSDPHKGLREGKPALRLRLFLLAQQRSTPASPVRLLPAVGDWRADPEQADADTFDGVHPNERGQSKLAERWFRSMLPFFDGARRTAAAAACSG